MVAVIDCIFIPNWNNRGHLLGYHSSQSQNNQRPLPDILNTSALCRMRATNDPAQGPTTPHPQTLQIILSHLNTLSICHYVWGGSLTECSSPAFSSFTSSWELYLRAADQQNLTWTTTTNSGVNFNSPLVTQQSSAPPPLSATSWPQWAVVVAVLFGWALGTMTIHLRQTHRPSRR